MSQPPGEPHDPRIPPQTRAFEPDQNPAEYPESGYVGAGQPAYTQPAYTQGAYTAGPYAGGPGGPADPDGSGGGGSGGGGRRTLYLALAVVAALVIIVVAAVLIVRSSGGDESSAAASSTTTVSSERPSSSTTTTTTEETTTTTEAASGSVVYQLTGSGDVAGVRYRAGTDFAIDPVTAAPWSKATRVGGGTAELTAVVLRGPVTCTILQGEELLTSNTSNGGLLRCVADLPN
ncbi:hypothetical protein ABLE92_19585 [Gordonia sp. VNQ95]|uniref:hypothetical protein n=1 Tax=Gordonia sp. VNQ95 TaxID=3156619 RepID=UPI0032B564AB